LARLIADVKAATYCQRVVIGVGLSEEYTSLVETFLLKSQRFIDRNYPLTLPDTNTRPAAIKKVVIKVHRSLLTA
jgi:hypothetical protein